MYYTEKPSGSKEIGRRQNKMITFLIKNGIKMDEYTMHKTNNNE